MSDNTNCYHFHFPGTKYLAKYIDQNTIGGLLIRLHHFRAHNVSKIFGNQQEFLVLSCRLLHTGVQLSRDMAVNEVFSCDQNPLFSRDFELEKIGSYGVFFLGSHDQFDFQTGFKSAL